MATYYVRQSGGSDSNAGTSFAAGWATIQKALDECNAGVLSAGDVVVICADGTHSIASESALTSAGSLDVLFTGGNSTGGIDGTRATIQASSSGWFGIDLLTINHTGLSFANLVFDGNSLAYRCVYLDSSAGDNGWSRCRFTGAVGNGFDADYEPDQNFSHCQFDLNGGKGLRDPSRAMCVDCFFDSNVNDGVDGAQGRNRYINCVFYNNGTGGTGCGARANSYSCFENCTFDSNESDGLCVGTGPVWATDCLFTNNGEYGMDGDGQVGYAIRCVFGSGDDANTSGGSTDVTEIDCSTGTAAYDDAAGDDFTPGSGAGAIDAGQQLPFEKNGSVTSDAGAVQRSTTTGGGGFASFINTGFIRKI